MGADSFTTGSGSQSVVSGPQHRITWELVRNADSWSSSQTHRIRNSEGWAQPSLCIHTLRTTGLGVSSYAIIEETTAR